MIVDGHLDIAWNALADGRSFTSEPAEGHLVSHPALSRAGVGLVFATIYCAPARRRGALNPGFSYQSPREANLMARAQLGYYRSSGLELLRDRESVGRYASRWRRGQLAAILLMEGADPIESPRDLAFWARAGLRIVGPAWGTTRYSGGTGPRGVRPGPGLTPLGFQLLEAMRRHHLILDLSHMSDRSITDALGAWRGPVIASHSNSRSLCPGERQLTARTVRELASRGGVVGVSFYARHLRGTGETGLGDVVEHIRRHAADAGSPDHVGLGTDLDGGFGADLAPLRSLGELARLRRSLLAHFSSLQVDGILGGNWLRFLERQLPAPGRVAAGDH